LLAVIIEEISGIPYQKYVEQNVFSPCGMIDSGFFTMNELPERTANGYVKTESGWRTNIYNLPIVGAGDGGAFVTVEDMKKFWISLFSYKIIDKELLEIFMQPSKKEKYSNTDIYYGHGFYINKAPHKEAIPYLLIRTSFFRL